MPTTFHTVNMLNTVVRALHHSTAMAGQPTYYLELWSGAQPSDPSATPAGTLLHASFVMPGKWSAPSAGVSQLASPASVNATSTSTVGFCRLKSSSSSLPMIDTTVGLAGSGAGCILSSLSTSSGSPITVTNLDIKMPYDAGGTLKLNSDLVNKLVNMLINSAEPAAQMGINGSILIYSGGAPANADMAPTGTLLATIPTGSATPWNTAPVGGAAGLQSDISAAASATGTAGYVRWVKDLYTVQGSVGTAAADFVVDSVSLVAGVPVTLTEATITLG